MTTYATYEASVADGRPYHLYLFTDGTTSWRFSDRAAAWDDGSNTWAASAISHGNILQSGDARRVDLSVTFPISDTFARRFLGVRSQAGTTLTIYRGHEQVAETVAHWVGRVVSARAEGERITLRCESIQTSQKREGPGRAYSRICDHALYGDGCTLSVASFYTAGTATARTGQVYTVAAAAGEADGYYTGGIIKFGDTLGYITEHTGTSLTVAGRMPDLEAAIGGSPAASVSIAPGCDRRRETCIEKFNNLVNYGGFRDIPTDNPFDGTSIV